MRQSDRVQTEGVEKEEAVLFLRGFDVPLAVVRQFFAHDIQGLYTAGAHGIGRLGDVSGTSARWSGVEGVSRVVAVDRRDRRATDSVAGRR